MTFGRAETPRLTRVSGCHRRLFAIFITLGLVVTRATTAKVPMRPRGFFRRSRDSDGCSISPPYRRELPFYLKELGATIVENTCFVKAQARWYIALSMDSGLLIAVIAAIGLLGAAGIFAWAWRGRNAASGKDDQSAELAQQAAQQAAQRNEQALTQMMEVLRGTQSELARQREGLASDQARLREEVRRGMGDNQKLVQERLAETNQTINARLGQAAQLFTDISKGLGSVSEFSKQLSNLRDVFQSPKLRGNIGEEVLKDLLDTVLPRGHYHMQFKFKEGQVVDAIVKTKQGLIPIDSKFPMENFRALSQARDEGETNGNSGMPNAATTETATTDARRAFVRDVKKHIDAIQSKYILPEEGTVDFAVMYVPSEAIYYEIVQRSEELMDYAAERRVYLVSPNTFYYFLKVIMIGLEGARMEELSRQVLQLLRTVQKDSAAFGEELSVLSRHVTNAKNAADRVGTKFERLSGKLDDVNLLESKPGTALPSKNPKQNIEQLEITL